MTARLRPPRDAAVAGVAAPAGASRPPRGPRAGSVAEAHPAGARDGEIAPRRGHRDPEATRGGIYRTRLGAGTPIRPPGL